MHIKEITLDEFNLFCKNNIIGNFYQSINYALLKSEEGFDYEFIGLVDNTDIYAAALILYKKLGNTYYGYSPRGFLIDYSDSFLLETFTNLIKDYYKKKNFTFIKINPEIAIGKLDKNTLNFEYNNNYNVISNLNRCGYKKLKNNMYFEALLPRINAIINLEEMDINTFSKNTRNKIRKGLRKGLTLEKVGLDKLSVMTDFLKHDKQNYYFLNNLYSVFDKSGDVDFFLVKVNYKEYLINSQNYYNYELLNNSNLNDKLIRNNNAKSINAKMNSDKALLSYKNDVADASKYLNTDVTTYVAGAIVIKFLNRVSIFISGFDHNLKRYAANYYLYYAILEYYKGKYKYVDLNGITADFSLDNPYHGLNRFKMGFNPDIYEYIGEFDLVINENNYNHLLKNGTLAKEFNKN